MSEGGLARLELQYDSKLLARTVYVTVVGCRPGAKGCGRVQGPTREKVTGKLDEEAVQAREILKLSIDSHATSPQWRCE